MRRAQSEYFPWIVHMGAKAVPSSYRTPISNQMVPKPGGTLHLLLYRSEQNLEYVHIYIYSIKLHIACMQGNLTPGPFKDELTPAPPHLVSLINWAWFILAESINFRGIAKPRQSVIAIKIEQCASALKNFLCFQGSSFWPNIGIYWIRFLGGIVLVYVMLPAYNDLGINVSNQIP